MFLPMPVTSAPIERLFSISCKRLSSDRCCLLHKNLENVKVNDDLI